MYCVQPTRYPTAALVLVSAAVLARLDGPLEKVRGLRNDAYTSPAFFEFEQKTFVPRWPTRV